MRRIQRIQPSPHVQGRYLVFFEGEKLLKVTEDEMLRFSLCAGLTLEEDTYAELTRCASRSHTGRAGGLRRPLAAPGPMRGLGRALERGAPSARTPFFLKRTTSLSRCPTPPPPM